MADDNKQTDESHARRASCPERDADPGARARAAVSAHAGDRRDEGARGQPALRTAGLDAGRSYVRRPSTRSRS